MANENEINETRKNFISNYANPNYAKYQAIRERVRDCATGTATMRGIGAHSQNGGGNDFTTVKKYLIPTARQNNHDEEYLRYMMMADFPGYTESTALVALGLLGTGSDTIDGIEHLPESLKKFAEASKLMQFRILLNRAQLLDGGAVVFLQPTSAEDLQAGKPAFEMILYSLDKYICSQLDPAKGAPFILMDESDFVYDYQIKQQIYKNRYRVHALDKNGEYYQAAILAEQWAGFDIASPEPWDASLEQSEPDNPQFGKAFYPMFGSRADFIPFDFCNVTHNIPGKYENPLLGVIADKDILIYNYDAAYRQTLWLTSQPIDVIIGDGKDQNLPYGAGAVHNLPKEFQEFWLEFSGAGAGAQEKALNDMHTRAQEKAMSLIATGSNISGAALQIIQGSQVAPLISMVNTSGKTIETILNYAAKWSGYKGDELKYIPSEVFSRLNLTAGDIMSLISMKRSAPDTVPVKWVEIRRRMEESGIGDEIIQNFTEFMEEIREENKSVGIQNEPVMRFDEEEGDTPAKNDI